MGKNYCVVYMLNIQICQCHYINHMHLILILQVLCFILMICAAVVVGAVNNVEDNVEKIEGIEYKNAGSYRSAAGWLIFVSIWGMIIEIGVIILRFLNVSFISLEGIIFRGTVSHCFLCVGATGYMGPGKLDYLIHITNVLWVTDY